mgnify:CR=1 FL=1
MLLTGVFSSWAMFWVNCRFQPYLLFFLGDVVDGNFKAEVLEDDALHDEGASVLVDVYGHPSFFVVGGALLRLD